MRVDMWSAPPHNDAPQAQKGSYIMAIKRQQSNIINLAFTITTEDAKSGVELSQAIVNGVSAGVGMRTVNGARKSAEVKLDRSALVDLQGAISEVLEGME